MKFSNIFTADGFQNFAARLGLGAGSQNDQSTYGFDFLSRDRVKLEAMYRSSWVVGQVVDVVAEDMTREGVNLRGLDDPSDAEEIQRAMDDLEIWNELTNVIKWGRLYGGAIAVMLIDGQNVSTPLNIDTVGKDSFKGLMVLDRWLVQPTLQDLVSEYGPDFGMPKYYDVIADSLGLSNQRIHHSRVIRFDGVDLPYWQRVAENLWGQSVIERLMDRLIAFDSTTTGIAQLVYKAHLRTYKVKDLRKMIGMGGAGLTNLVKQIEHIRLWQSNEGMTLMDAEDTFETHSYSFAGLDAVMLQFGQQLSGASQIPLVRLFGQSPSGMNATGESDLSNYYDNINQQQERRMRTGLGKLLKIVSLSTLGKPLPNSFTFDFASLWQIDDVQKADIATKVTDAVCKAEEQGLISTQAAMKELRQSSEITGIFSNITDADIDTADDEVPKPQGNYDDGEDPPHTEPGAEGGEEIRQTA